MSSKKPIITSREFYRGMFAHFRIPVVKARGRVTLLQSKIKIKEKNIDEREEIEQEEEKKRKYRREIHAAARIFGTARQDSPSLCSGLKRTRLWILTTVHDLLGLFTVPEKRSWYSGVWRYTRAKATFVLANVRKDIPRSWSATNVGDLWNSMHSWRDACGKLTRD